MKITAKIKNSINPFKLNFKLEPRPFLAATFPHLAAKRKKSINAFYQLQSLLARRAINIRYINLMLPPPFHTPSSANNIKIFIKSKLKTSWNCFLQLHFIGAFVRRWESQEIRNRPPLARTQTQPRTHKTLNKYADSVCACVTDNIIIDEALARSHRQEQPTSQPTSQPASQQMAEGRKAAGEQIAGMCAQGATDSDSAPTRNRNQTRSQRYR